MSTLYYSHCYTAPLKVSCTTHAEGLTRAGNQSWVPTQAKPHKCHADSFGFLAFQIQNTSTNTYTNFKFKYKFKFKHKYKMQITKYKPHQCHADSFGFLTFPFPCISNLNVDEISPPEICFKIQSDSFGWLRESLKTK